MLQWFFWVLQKVDRDVGMEEAKAPSGHVAT
jgi:hypothetical protein